MHLNLRVLPLFWSRRRVVLSLFFRLNLVTPLNRFCEQCSLEGLNNNVSKFLTAQQYITNIIFPWLDRFFLSPWEEIVHWSDQRRHQTSATPFEHETVGSYYSLPSLSARRALHHPYPRAFYPLPSFARIKRQRWWPLKPKNRHLQSHSKIRDCEQSTDWMFLNCCLLSEQCYLLGLLSQDSCLFLFCRRLPEQDYNFL